MSKEILLRFAKGDSIEPKYICSYETDRDTGEITIHSCSIVPGLDSSIFVRICNSKEDLANTLSGEELHKAVEAYLNGGNRAE